MAKFLSIVVSTLLSLALADQTTVSPTAHTVSPTGSPLGYFCCCYHNPGAWVYERIARGTCNSNGDTCEAASNCDSTASPTNKPTKLPSASPTISPTKLPTTRPTTSSPSLSPTYPPQPSTCSGGVAPAENIQYLFDNPTCANSSANSTTVWGTFEAVYSVDCVSSCWGNVDRSSNGLIEISLEVVANTTDSNFVLQNVYDGKSCTGVPVSTWNVDMAEYCGLWTGGCISGDESFFENQSFSIPTGLPNGFAMPPVCVNSIMNARSTTTGSSQTNSPTTTSPTTSSTAQRGTIISAFIGLTVMVTTLFLL